MSAAVIDLDARRAAREACYRPTVDPTLPHQLTLHFVHARTAVQGRCNCGAAFGIRAPEADGSMAETLSEYAAHVDWVLR